MARFLKAQNDSEKALILGSLTVLGEINNSGIQVIKKEVSTLSKGQQTAAEKQNEFWKSLASDLIITPSEKISLKKEWQQIVQTYSAITTDLDKGIASTSELVNYTNAFNTLKQYLFSSLKVFDDMTLNTELDDAESFNNLFSDYYYRQTLAQNRITIGLVEKYGQGLRTLTSLNQIGLEGEIAVYNSGFYQYDASTGKWVLINTSNTYMGAFDHIPKGETGAFFLLKKDATYYRRLLTTAGNYLMTGDGRFLLATKKLLAGSVLYYEGGSWHEVTDSNDWRRMIALGDILKYGGVVPEALQQYVTDQQDDYWSDMSSDDVITALEKTSLYNQWLSIQSTYQMINVKFAQDTDKLNELQNTDPALYAYYLSYFSLNNHIAADTEVSIHLFDDMAKETRLSDYGYTGKDFNLWFSEYYENETYARALYSSTVANDIVSEKMPSYLGRVTEEPDTLSKNDYFVWASPTVENENTSSGYFKFGYLYKYENTPEYKYHELDATEQDLEDGTLSYSQEFMTALADILYLNASGNGYFASVFAKAIYSSAAFITNLQTRTITLEEGGSIQSDGYTHGVSGLCIDYNGNAHFEGNTHIGGVLNVDGNTTIGGKTDITAAVSAYAFQISGVAAGDIVLRDLGVRTCEIGNTWRLFSQIIASGTVRIKLVISEWSYSGTSEAANKMSFFIGNSANYETKRIYGNGTYNYDISVNENAPVYISYDGSSVGVVVVSPTAKARVYICTNSNNNVLAYLGTQKSETTINPIR